MEIGLAQARIGSGPDNCLMKVLDLQCAHAHVFDHALPQWRARVGGRVHGCNSVDERGGLPRSSTSQNRDCNGRPRSGRSAYRDSGLVRCRSLDIPLAEVRQLLAFAARPEQSCAQVNDLLDGHIRLVTQRIRALNTLEKLRNFLELLARAAV